MKTIARDPAERMHMVDAMMTEASMTEERSATDSPVPLRDIALTALYIGVTGYGGPAIIGHMKQLFVTRRRWVSEEDFLTGLSLSQMLPGATGVNLMTFLGYQLRGAWGAFLAPLGFIFPALVLMTLLSAIYFTYGQVPLAQAMFIGLGAVVVGLLVNATVTLGRSAIRDRWGIVIAVLGFVLVFWLHISILFVVAISAVLGWLVYRKQSVAITNGDTPLTVKRTSRGFWVGLVLTLLAVSLILVFTRQTLMTQMFLAIVRVAVLTFGGGFTSIPLFQHEVITVHGWLTTRAFLDGIALGQITPGPVLITATFIGYHLYGVIGALVGSIAIFTPGALAMLLLAHQHERVRQLSWLQAIVRGVVASFIGVLVSVSIQLGLHSLVDVKTVALAIGSVLVLLVAKKDPVWVILGAALLSPFLFS